MHHTLVVCAGGTVGLPKRPMNHGRDGGHLLVNPPRPVWERSELTPDELVRWACLVAATGKAMLDTLPQLDGGCLNYWEAGNNALNALAQPVGPKTPRLHRKMHLHVFGRSPKATHPDWQWGEPPRFPAFAQSDAWCAQFRGLEPGECVAIAARIQVLLTTRYGMGPLASAQVQAAGGPVQPGVGRA
jgi:diadenosine tetraphosphate (Ap4A) HIT family hydrolase